MVIYIRDNGLITDKSKKGVLTFIVWGANTNIAEAFLTAEGALMSGGNFVWDDEHGCYSCSKAIFDWWAQTLERAAKLVDRLIVLSSNHGNEAVDGVLDKIPDSPAKRLIVLSVKQGRRAFSREMCDISDASVSGVIKAIKYAVKKEFGEDSTSEGEGQVS